MCCWPSYPGQRLQDHSGCATWANPVLCHKAEIGAIIVQQLPKACRIAPGLADQVVYTNIIFIHRKASNLVIAHGLVQSHDVSPWLSNHAAALDREKVALAGALSVGKPVNASVAPAVFVSAASGALKLAARVVARVIVYCMTEAL